jgi:hypothetical protein
MGWCRRRTLPDAARDAGVARQKDEGVLGLGLAAAHICTGTGPTHATSAPGLGSLHPHLHLDWAHPLPQLHRDWAHASRIGTGTGPAPFRLQACPNCRNPIEKNGGCGAALPSYAPRPHSAGRQCSAIRVRSRSADRARRCIHMTCSPPGGCAHWTPCRRRRRWRSLRLIGRESALGSPLPHLHRDWAHRCEICTGTRAHGCHKISGTGLILPHLHRDWAALGPRRSGACDRSFNLVHSLAQAGTNFAGAASRSGPSPGEVLQPSTTFCNILQHVATWAAASRSGPSLGEALR